MLLLRLWLAIVAAVLMLRDGGLAVLRSCASTLRPRTETSAHVLFCRRYTQRLKD